jgi:hypothetical protein
MEQARKAWRSGRITERGIYRFIVLAMGVSKRA